MARTRAPANGGSAQVQIDGLEAAKGTLDPGEALVGADHVVGRQGFVFDAGADDIKTVEPGFLGDAGWVAAKEKPSSPTVMSNSLASL